MELLACLAGIAMLALVVGGIFGAGWLVIQPLGVINRTRVMTARFQLLDLLLLVVLLQPSLAGFGWLIRESSGNSYWRHWIGIFLLIWGTTIAAWYVTTGALSKAGVTSTAKRVVAVLVILPMIGVVIPVGILAQFVIVAAAMHAWNNGSLELWLALGLGCVFGELVFVAALFGCRRLSRWIADGVGKG